MRKRLIPSLLVAGVVFGAVTGAWASMQARIKGTVTDLEGNGLKGAVITITCDELQDFEKTVKCDDDGTFSVLLMDATRHFSFRAEAPGYVTHKEAVKVAPGSTNNDIDIPLSTPDQAREANAKVLALEPGYKEMEEGRTLFKDGKLEEARAKYQAASEIIPNVVQTWIGLSEIADQLGDTETAYTSAKKCLELDAEALSCLAVAINSANVLGHKEDHQQLFLRYQELVPDDPAILFNQAADHLNRMDDEQARPILEKCLEADPEFSRCLFEFGMLLLRSGDLEGAKAKLQEYLKVDPEGPDATTAVETIKYL
ncbi:MAG: tetratricopeptide repeat protein [bacterium]|nr:tetratricopeptide repeat protein [bacterium]